ncbi:MAG: class D beta-lactamase [Leptolyngbya foveolarum]|uniref:Beta-lactamase n=1 Tax=Leptolyngbya foveolarum TaxID=47253 RepID=A0A2W4WEP2_9CYAN|nr:MAG: class D beta-lactamase [Leptolyngbya foveolarum]
MRRVFYWLGALIISSVIATTIHSAYAATESTIEPTAQIAQQTTAADFAQHFQDLDVKGSILIYDQNQDLTYQYNPERNATPFLPGSTFKILNSLIALETGVIENDIAVLTWDGIERIVPAWNRDLNMRTAFNLSAVWFYQVLARRVGHERMQQWVADAGYGNQTIGNPEEIDAFWLEGDLRTTPQEQIQFLRQLYDSDLPFSEEAITLVKDIMVVEKTPSYTIRAKSGWVGFGEPEQEQIGWYVGYVEQNNNAYFFATNIDIRNDDDPKARATLTRLSLESLGLL